MLQSGVKQSSHVLRKDGAKSTPKLRQTAVTVTNNSNVTNPSQVGYVSDNNIFPEVPSEGQDDHFYDLSSQESDTVSNVSDHAQDLVREAVSEKANIESMMARIRKSVRVRTVIALQKSIIDSRNGGLMKMSFRHRRFE
ncbi:hypothetical protein F2Q68_00005647 [Brassica cretica]|uniref:Uncharacterized protein n=3 Tax=Brassica TaxID=3705 RepID=A0A8S9J8X0_BRACR|nr:hypothetical protein F2Q68_00005647 [Brassica cretica]KAF3569186.1 hypothetical protein DY000_02018051 [Brassica cretica]